MDLEYRAAVELRANAEKGTVSGLAVPYDTPTDLGYGVTETIQRGAVEEGPISFFWQHQEVIGKVVSRKDTDDGLWIEAKISDTTQGRDALTLLRDGAVTGLSIGFEAIEQQYHYDDAADTVDVVRTKIRVREVSAVDFPAYSEAQVMKVRSAALTHQDKEAPTMGETITRADLDGLRTTIDEIGRRVDLIPTHTDAAPAADTRSAGEVLKSIVAGDQSTIDAYQKLQERAYSGGTTADVVLKPGWVGDLTRIFDASSGVLADVFSTGALPSSGMSIEFAELSTNTIAVAEQAAEGNDIGFGKVAITTRTAPVKTYAGGTQLTRQEIERATVGVLNTSLEALAMAAGVRKKLVLRAAYNALVTARAAIASDAGVVALGATLAAGTAGNWEDLLVDAALKFETIGLPLEALIVSSSVFKKLRSLTVSGERVFQTYRDNASGELNLTGLTGQLAGLPVRLDSAETGNTANFVNGRAIRQYDSALVSLSDENIVNLSKTFAVYRYGAVAAEIPAGIVPVKFAS